MDQANLTIFLLELNVLMDLVKVASNSLWYIIILRVCFFFLILKHNRLV